jgi:hypothetical protein
MFLGLPLIWALFRHEAEKKTARDAAA